MGNRGSASELEARRRLAVARVNEGWKQVDVAAFLGVSTKAVGNWVAAYRERGDDGLKGKPHPGPSPKLTGRQERSVLSWLAKSPKAFGYATELWTTRRLAQVIERRFKVRFNSNYLAEWLTRRGYTPQKPGGKGGGRGKPASAPRVPRGWPPVKKKSGAGGPPQALSTRTAFF